MPPTLSMTAEPEFISPANGDGQYDIGKLHVKSTSPQPWAKEVPGSLPPSTQPYASRLISPKSPSATSFPFSSTTRISTPQTGKPTAPARALPDLLKTAIQKDEVLKKKKIELKETAALINISGGDARKLLNLLELIVEATPAPTKP